MAAPPIAGVSSAGPLYGCGCFWRHSTPVWSGGAFHARAGPAGPGI